MNHQPDIDKIYLHPKDPYEAKCQFLINEQESTDLKHFSDSKDSNEMDDIHKIIKEYNPNKKRKILVLRYFSFEVSFKLRWTRAKNLFRLQIPVTTGRFELQIFCIRSSYLTH